jgi:hypothetical protein
MMCTNDEARTESSELFVVERPAPNPAPARQADSPTSHDHQLLLERRGAEANGFEMPLDSGEAAAYIGAGLSDLISLVLAGEIYAHPVAGGAWTFYVSELNEWLAKNADHAVEDLLHTPHVERGT